MLSPDGRVLFYSYYGGMKASWLRSRSLETGEEVELYHPPVSPPWIGPTFALSPDGRHVAFFFPHSSTSSALHVVPAGGGKPRQLLSVKEPEYLNSHVITWTPDGRHILVARGDRAENKMALWRVPADGGAPEKLAFEISPETRDLRVHPDGRQVAFTDRHEVDEIWALENFLPDLRAAR